MDETDRLNLENYLSGRNPRWKRDRNKTVWYWGDYCRDGSMLTITLSGRWYILWHKGRQVSLLSTLKDAKELGESIYREEFNPSSPIA